MTVFKYYLKIAKRYLPMILGYSAIFLGISIFAAFHMTETTEYKSVDVKVAVINHDQKSELVDGFIEYIEDNAKLVELEDNQEALSDAMFFRKVDYIMIIPENYSDDFIADKDVSIKTMELPDSYGSIYSKNLMNRYLNTAKLYLKADIDEADLAKLIKDDLGKKTEVELLNQTSEVNFNGIAVYYNFSNYMLITIILTIITMITVSFNDEKIQRRNNISPFNYKKINQQLLLGNYVVGIGIWAFYVICSFGLHFEAMMSKNGLLFIINSFIMMIFVQAFSFMVSKFTSNREVLSGIGNVFGLGTSFICGAFVPQSLLSPFVLTIAKFLPSYWFIKANNEIAAITNFNLATLQPILLDMALVIGFTVVVYIITQVISKLRLKK